MTYPESERQKIIPWFIQSLKQSENNQFFEMFEKLCLSGKI